MAAKHAKPKEKDQKIRNIATAAGIAIGGASIPLIAAPSANAATLDAWERIAQCEASGNWSINHSSDGLSVGGLQFINPSWRAALDYLNSQGIDTSSWPQNLYQGMPNVPTKEQQLLAGEALLHLQGGNAWVCNWPGHGAASGALNGQKSMFDGGPNPGVSTSPSTPPSTPPPSTGGGGTYVVKSGDNLSAIAAKLGVKGGWQVLYNANKSVIGSNPNLIFPGQRLTIPGGGTSYTVRLGDSLSAIAARYHVAGGWQALYEANKSVVGSNPNLIFPGQVLTIPGGGATTPAPAPGPVKPPAEGWAKPIDARVTGGFHVPGNYGTGWHTGVDFSAASGTPVKAVSKATVVHAGYGGAGGAYGNHVILRLADGRYALYGHLSAHTVSVGQVVGVGSTVGRVGSTGNSTGPHLHFEIRWNATAYTASNFLDPVAYLSGHGVSI